MTFIELHRRRRPSPVAGRRRTEAGALAPGSADSASGQRPLDGLGIRSHRRSRRSRHRLGTPSAATGAGVAGHGAPSRAGLRARTGAAGAPGAHRCRACGADCRPRRVRRTHPRPRHLRYRGLPSSTASATAVAYSWMARMASSLPGIMCSMPSGEQLVSTTATTGMPSFGPRESRCARGPRR